ncbi:MAG: hypothetical protein WC656_00705 [Sulfurimonas sp.]|jgi:hypothetical protein
MATISTNSSVNTQAPLWRDSHLQLSSSKEKASDVASATKTDNTTKKAETIELNDTQKRGMKVIEHTLNNKDMNEKERAEILQTQQKVFGLSDSMVNQATSEAKTEKATQKAESIEMNDTQKRGMKVVQSVLNNKNMDEKEKAEIVQAQQKAFGLSNDMINQATGVAKNENTTQTQTTQNKPDEVQKIGMKALMNELNKDFSVNGSSSKRINQDAQNSIIKAFNLSKDLVNQVAEQFAKDDENKYIFAKQRLGKTMGLDIQA